MQVNAERTVEVDLRRRHGILATWLLAEMVVVDNGGAPINVVRINLWSTDALEHVDVHFFQNVRISTDNLRNNVTFDD